MSNSKNKFSDSYLKQNGIDAEEVKKDYVGSEGGKYDIYNGDTVTIDRKDGKESIDTEMTKSEFFEFYGNSKEKEND